MEQKEVIAFLFFSSVLLLIFLSAAVIFIFQFRKRKITYLIETEKLTEEHSRQLLSTQLEIQTQTMQHIGREIHDNVGQKLTLASLFTQQLAYENKAPQVNDKIENISSIINESLVELRLLSKSLTDDTISNTNIITLLQQECEKITALKKLVVQFNSTEKNILLPYQTKSILLRVVQEFFQNSIKHAVCKNLQLELNATDKELILLLADDGKGFDTNNIASTGIGLNNIKKRIELIGCTYQLTSTIGSGTQLSIKISL